MADIIIKYGRMHGGCGESSLDVQHALILSMLTMEIYSGLEKNEYGMSSLASRISIHATPLA
jgi:hypothetical protein